MESTQVLLFSLRKCTLVLKDKKPLKERCCATPVDRSLQLISRSEGQETHYDTKLASKNLNLGYYHKPFAVPVPYLFLKGLSFSFIHLRNAAILKGKPTNLPVEK